MGMNRLLSGSVPALEQHICDKLLLFWLQYMSSMDYWFHMQMQSTQQSYVKARVLVCSLPGKRSGLRPTSCLQTA